MILDLSEKNIVRILNSISLFMMIMNGYPSKEKMLISNFMDYNNFCDDYEELRILHRYISTTANYELYNRENETFFEGQKLFLQKKNFEYLNSKMYDFNIDNKLKIV